MELILTGRTISAREAEAAGLVSLVVPAEETLDRALELAGRIAAMPPIAVRAAKAMVNRAFEFDPDRGPGRRAPDLLRPVRDRGSDGGHGRLRGEASAGLARTVRRRS